MRIVPAILTNDSQDLKDKINLAATFTDYVQIDIMDGQFVPSRSVPAEALLNLETKLRLEIHLMVKKPVNYIAGFKRIGAQRIIFHYEASGNQAQTIKKIKAENIQPGLALNPATPVEAIKRFLPELNSILVMTVNPGFYGSKFIPECLKKVGEIRNLDFRGEIGVDGGVNQENIEKLKNIGLDYVCVGSAIFVQDDPRKAFLNLKTLVG